MPSPLLQGLRALVSMPDGPPGAIALVQTGSQITVETAGVGDVATGQPIAAGDTVRIASVSKAFNGAVALSLVTHKQLSLTDTVGRLLPFSPIVGRGHPGRVAPPHQRPPRLHPQPFLLGPAQGRSPRRAHATPTPQLRDPPVPPVHAGSRYGYSDTDNIVVGLMIEAVTHESYEAALAREVTGPLDLAGTTLPDSPELTEPYIHGYAVNPGAPPEDISTYLNPGLAWASGGMLSTPAELNEFMRAYVRGMFTDRPPGASNSSSSRAVRARLGRAQMQPGWPFSDTRQPAARSTGTPETSPATPSSPRQPRTDPARSPSSSTSNSTTTRSPRCSPNSVSSKASGCAPRSIPEWR